MPNFNDGSQFFTEKQAAASGTATPSEILKLCATLKAILTDIMRAQIQLDGECWAPSSASNVEVTLLWIRVARRRCGRMADKLFKTSPTTQQESVALNNVLAAYLAQVDVDRMACHQHFSVAFGSEELGSEVTLPEIKPARSFSLSFPKETAQGKSAMKTS